MGRVTTIDFYYSLRTIFMRIKTNKRLLLFAGILSVISNARTERRNSELLI